MSAIRGKLELMVDRLDKKDIVDYYVAFLVFYMVYNNENKNDNDLQRQ